MYLKDAASDIGTITTAITDMKTKVATLTAENSELKAQIAAQYDQLTAFEASLKPILKALGL